METTVMALVGVHIAFGASSVGIYNSSGLSPIPPTSWRFLKQWPRPRRRRFRHLLVLLLFGETQPMLSISASAPMFYAVGPTPDANNGPRRYMDPSFGREDIFVNPGDKFAWVFA
jgi:hypothetical protein